MRPKNYAQESRNVGRAWFAVPLSVAAAVVAVVLMLGWPQPPGDGLAESTSSTRLGGHLSDPRGADFNLRADS